jgi:hypothetical protein
MFKSHINLSVSNKWAKCCYNIRHSYFNIEGNLVRRKVIRQSLGNAAFEDQAIFIYLEQSVKSKNFILEEIKRRLNSDNAS